MGRPILTFRLNGSTKRLIGSGGKVESKLI